MANDRTQPGTGEDDSAFKLLSDERVLNLDEWELMRYMNGRLNDVLQHSSYVADTLLQSFARDENTTNEIEVDLPDGRNVRLEKWPEPNQTVLQWNCFELIVDGIDNDGGRTEVHMFVSPRLFMINEATYDDVASDIPIAVNRYGTSALPNTQCEPEGAKSSAEMKLQALGILKDLEGVIRDKPDTEASRRCV